MAQPPNRLLRLSGALVATLLVALAFYPGTLASPYVTERDSPRHAHAIVPESSAIYDENIGEHVEKRYRYDELSPTAQTFVDRTKTAENHQYTPVVCRDFTLVCDRYSLDELPEEFTYGTELPREESLAFIEDGDDRHLFQTGYTSHATLFAVPLRLFTAWLTMIPLAALVAVVTVASESDRAIAGAVGGGALVAALGFLTPYVEMVGLVSGRVLGPLLLGSVWIGILAAGGYWLYQSTFDGE